MMKPIKHIPSYFKEKDLIKIIKRNPNDIQFIKNPSKKIQLLAALNGAHVSNFKNTDKETKLALIKCNAMSIQRMKDIEIDEEIKLAAVNQDGYAIVTIKDPSEQIQLATINKTPWYIKNIKNPCQKAQEFALSQDITLIIKYPEKFNKSLKKKYEYLLIPSKLGIFDE